MKGLRSIFEKSYHYLYVFAGAALMFDVYYLVMARLPGVENNSCTVGAGLTPGNILFSGVLSVLAAVMIFAIVRMIQMRLLSRRSLGGNLATGSSLGLGFVVGFFTVFCALCTIPVISLFGFSVGLGFFTTYNVFFKALSLALMGLALWQVNKRLQCDRCII